MTYNRKIYSAMTLLLFSFIGCAEAACNDRPACCEQEYCSPCRTDCCGGFFLNGDLLYMRAFEGGLNCVCDGTQIVDTTTDGVVVSTLEGRADDPDFNWNLGFNVGVGYNFGPSNCDLGVYWTHYNSHTGDGSSENQLRWNIDFDSVDVLFGCECECSSCFALIPFGGIRSVNINQKLNTLFLNIENAAITTVLGTLRQRFIGIGPLLGIEGDWRSRCGFSLYGFISGAILYGSFNVKANQTNNFTTGININHLRQHLQAVEPVVDVGIGIRWKTCLCNHTLLWQLGLEHQHYFNMNQFQGYGDLGFDSVSLGLIFEF